MTSSAANHAALAAWETVLARHARAPAIFSTAGAVLRTFAQLEAEARELEERLFADLPAGAVAAIQIGNDPRWPALLLALFRRGLVVAPLGSHMENRELETALTITRATVRVTVSSGNLALIRTHAALPVWTEPRPVLLKLTSGTTSQPRAIRFRAEQLLADGQRICATMGITPADRNFGVIPFSHSYGFSNLITPLLCVGVPLVVSDDRMPRAIMNDLARSGATVFPGMPIFFQKLSELQNPLPLPTLRLCISAGASLQPSVAEAFTDKFGVKIHSFYGSSECGGIAYDAHEQAIYREGYVGQTMPGVTITPHPTVPGLIVVQSSAVGDAYFPEEDPETLANGRFVPGDLVSTEPDGLVLAGRATELINIAGRKLNPLEVEARLAEYPGVNQVVVFGIPSTLRGEEAVACVAGEGLRSPDVLRFCRGRLSPWQVPRAVWVVAEIPTNDRGKISRRCLAASFLAARDRET